MYSTLRYNINMRLLLNERSRLVLLCREIARLITVIIIIVYFVISTTIKMLRSFEIPTHPPDK